MLLQGLLLVFQFSATLAHLMPIKSRRGGVHLINAADEAGASVAASPLNPVFAGGRAAPSRARPEERPARHELAYPRRPYLSGAPHRWDVRRGIGAYRLRLARNNR